MRVSLIPEVSHGPCSGCRLPGMVTTFTFTIGHATETSPPLCPGCLRDRGEVAVDIEQPPAPSLPNALDKRVKRASRRNEMRTAERVGGRVQPGSGNQLGAKGDVRVRGAHRIENKDSYSNQFIVRREVLDKIRGECGPGEKPAVVVTFMDRSGRRLDCWTMIPFYDWEDYANAAGQDR